jgi:putative ABC transport system permease protein
LPLRYRWRFQVDPARIDASQVAELRTDLRRVESTYGTGTGAGRLSYRSGLLDIVDRFVTRRAATEAALWVAAMGPLAVAGGALGLVAVIIVGRRRQALALARGRGASAGQLLAAQLLEGLLITVPAALVGLFIAEAAVPGRSTSVSPIGALAVALAVTLLLVAATWPAARRARRDLERGDTPIRRVSPRRTILEATIVGIAVAAVWLLRERGLGTQHPAAGDVGLDPFLAAAPVLVGVATGLLAIRLYPYPIRALAWLTARRRDLVPALGLRSIGRNPRAAYLPLLVLTLTIAIGVFSSVLSITIEKGQVAASWRDVGADYRIEAASGGALTVRSDLAATPGVEAVAAGVIAATTGARGEVGRQASTTLIAVEPGAYQAVLAGSPTQLRLPAALANASIDAGLGQGDQPIPAIVSRRLPNGWLPLGIGDVFRVAVREEPVTFIVVEFMDEFPGVRRGSTFIVASLGPVVAAREGPSLRPSVQFVRGPAEIGPALRAAAGEPSVVQVTSRHERLAAEQGAPLVAAVGQGFGVALAAAVVYALLAIVAVVALDAQRRARELAYLRTLGLSERQAFTLTVVEHAPPVLLALAIGVGLGLGLAWLLEPGLGLAAFIAPGAPVLLEVDWPAVAVVGLSAVVVVGLLVTTSAWLARRLDPGQALRMGD